jgi:Undecaprenyl-phosphate galactose phosphotransferase WbaP
MGAAHILVAEFSKAAGLLLFGHYMEAMIRKFLIASGLWGAPTALIGCSETSRYLAGLLARQPDLGLRPIGFVNTDSVPQPAELPLPLIGALADPGCIRSHFEVLVFSSSSELAAFAAAQQRLPPSCQLLLVEDVHDIQSLWLRTRMLGDAIGIEIRRDLCRGHMMMTKRIVDLLISIPVLLLASPVLLMLAAAIKIIDPGPALFVQERVGRNGSSLRVFKLRTMYADAEQRLEEYLSHNPAAAAQWRRFFKLDRDPRVLPVIGNFMRRASLDELPQLWNVIRGEMSLVGPRPFPPYHMNSFDASFQITRMTVQPGITGTWQISSRSDGDLQVQKSQDLFYIRNWSIWLDFYILLETIPAVLSASGAK